MNEVSADFETRSDIDLKRCGAAPYFASPRFKPLILAYSIDGAPVQEWTSVDRRDPPDDLRAHIENGGYCRAYNASFERQCFEWLADHWGWPRIAFDRYRCTLAQASALGLPRSLEKLGESLNLTVTKDKRGSALIRLFSVPNKYGAFNEPEDHPKEFAEFVAYCKTDTLTEMEAHRRMMPLSDAEQEVWLLDQKINARGIRIDRASAIAAISLIEKEKIRLDAEMSSLTGGAVGACTQVARLTSWVAAHGVTLSGVAKDDILEALDLVDLPDAVKSALLLRQEAGKSSTSKLKSFLAHAGADDRVRGSFVYHGAAPGRWSNVGVNFANLPRPRAIYDDAEIDAATLFKAFRTEEPQLLRELYGPELGRPLHLVSDALRGFIVAAPGCELIAVDYSGIQGAIGAWLANEQWKLRAMREIIADPTLPDLYRRAAAGILNTTTDVITKKHFMRQAVGKTSELALLFQGSVSALVGMAANYGMRRRALHDLYPAIWTAASEDAREKAVKRHERALKSRDKRRSDFLSTEAWLACSLIVAGWRRDNSASVEAWAALENAMRDAMRRPGERQRALGRVDYLHARGFLWCRLPSGRCIAYAAPKLKDQVWAKVMLDDGTWTESETMDRDEAERLERRGRARIEGATSPKVTALGVNSATQKLERYALYGGLGMENCVARGTKVLTPRGWKFIEDLLLSDMLWDGVEWVAHQGLISKGAQETINFAGVQMTPDHKVWHGDKWLEAKDADVHAALSASQDARPGRSPFRTFSRYKVCWGRWSKDLVARALRLRHGKDADRFRASEGQDAELRLLPGRTAFSSREDAWHVEAPSLLGVAQHDRPMQIANASSVQELRWPRNQSLRAVEEVSQFLGGHGRDVPNRFDDRTSRQHERLQTGELRMERLSATNAQQAKQCLGEHATRPNDFVRGARSVQDFCTGLLLACQSWMGRSRPIRSARVARLWKRRVLEVFDVVNAGPRHRFMVRAGDKTLIVSNCCLGIESDILRIGLLHCEAASYPVVCHTYDEIVAERPHGAGSIAEMEHLMLDLPPEYEGLPLSAHGWRGKRYRK